MSTLVEVGHWYVVTGLVIWCSDKGWAHYSSTEPYRVDVTEVNIFL